ncbi:MAG: hypothetical protein HS114_34760 [Anaerolineales bacterium]|nr:hypothetical protein [Anaerolineales bacterium]
MLPFYSDQTMWGPQGDPNKERPRLKPGDRMADGTIFMGDSPELVLLAELARVEDALRPLDAKRAELLVKLAEVNPEKYGQPIIGVATETEPAAPASSKKKAAKSA